jgi:lysozyme
MWNVACNPARSEGVGVLSSSVRRSLLPVVGAMIFLITSGSAVAAGPLPESRPGHLTGIDVSHWQGRIGWAKVKRAGIGFAIAKATEAQTFIDGQYSRNRERADALGLPFGAYHFARPDRTTKDAVREADHFVRVARLRGRHLLPVLDLEVHGGLGRDALIRWTRAWLRRVESHLGVKPMIYTSPSFWRERMGNTTWFANNGYRALWIAHWRVASPSVPAANWGGHGWTVWQVSDCGSVPGITGCVDVDLYKGLDIGPLRIRRHRGG